MGKHWPWFLVGLVGIGCSSSPKSNLSDPKVTVTETSVLVGKPNLYRDPLPVRVPLAIREDLSDGSSSTDDRFRGWDVNRDGRVDVVEKFDERGNLQSAAYDFDYDGKVDMVKNRRDSRSE